VVIFKTLVLQAFYNRSNDQAEYQLRDRLSFMRFLGLGIDQNVVTVHVAPSFRYIPP
jgi:IS5 family transposase